MNGTTGDVATVDGRYSVAFPRRWWYPACRSRDLRGRNPVPLTLLDESVVLWRDGGGRARALVDRCPHRNVPLSAGRVHGDGTLQCGYHGWRFDGTGGCAAVPGLLGEGSAASPTRNVGAYATAEQNGFVWIWPEVGVTPPSDREPFALPSLVDDGRPASKVGEVVFTYDLDCTMHAALENALDVPHTAFLHAGLFRGGAETRDIRAERRNLESGIEVQYLDEPVGFGPVKWPGKVFDHWDRFFLPCVAQIEYRVEPHIRIVNTILHLPLSPFRTRAWFVVRFASPLPAKVAAPIVLARGRGILRQDADFLKLQTDNARRFGGERYASTELDLIGNGIWRLLRQAERSERLEPEEEATVTFRA